MKSRRSILAVVWLVLLAVAGCSLFESDDDPMNAPPSAEIAGPSNATVGEVVALVVIGEAPGRNVTGTRIDFDGDETFDESETLKTASSSVSQPYEHTYTASGTFTIRAQILEGATVLATATLQITVAERPVPTLDLTADSTTPTFGQSVRFSLAGAASGQTITESRIDFDNDGTFDATQSHTTSSIAQDFNHVYPSIGSFTALAQIRNGSDVLAEATIGITVVAGQATLTLNASPSTQLAGAPIVFMLDGDGAGRTITTSRIDFDGDLSFDENATHNSGTISGVTYTRTYPLAGTFTVTAQILDGIDVLATAAVDVTIQAGAAVVSVDPMPQSAAIGQIVNFRVTGQTVGVIIAQSGIDFENNGSIDAFLPHASQMIVADYSHFYTSAGTRTVLAEILDTGGSRLATNTNTVGVSGSAVRLDVGSVITPSVVPSTACQSFTISDWTAPLINNDDVGGSAANDPVNRIDIQDVVLSYQWSGGLSTPDDTVALSVSLDLGTQTSVSFAPIDAMALDSSFGGHSATVTMTFRGQTGAGLPIQRQASGSLSVGACPLPNAPTNLLATPQCPGKMQLSWNHTARGATTFKIFRRDGMVGSFVEINETSNLSYEDASLPPNSSFSYRVRTVTGGIASSDSNTATNATLVCFASDVIPLFSQFVCPPSLPGPNRSCTTCHTGAAPAGGMNLNQAVSLVHAALLAPGENRVNTANVRESLILKKPSLDGVTHNGNQCWQINGAEYRLVEKWIELGALNTP